MYETEGFGAHVFFLNKKPGEGPSSKSFLFRFLIFLVKNGFLISI